MAKVEPEKKKATYVFPNILADLMSKVDMRTQLEASMLSMTFILFGMIVSGIYLAIYVSFPLWYKIVVVINIIAGIGFISSFIITTFQQYQSYMDIVIFQKELKEINNVKGGTQ